VPEQRVIRIVLVLLLIAVVFYGLRLFQKVPPQKAAHFFRIFFFSMLGFGLLYLGATGRLNWLFALAGLVIAFAARMLPLLLRYSPYLHRLWQEFIHVRQQSSGQQGGRQAPNGAMTRSEAFEVLGLKSGASQDEIVAAHRKLMQKIHPDRGGSDYLAAKINLAKKILLSK
jgi:hypothetical protein